MCEAADEECAAVTVEGAASMAAIADCSRDFQTWTKPPGSSHNIVSGPSWPLAARWRSHPLEHRTVKGPLRSEAAAH
jgi:hypothetical protein